MKTALRLLLAPYRFSVDRLFRMGEVGGAHWFTDPNTLYRRRNRLTYTRDFSNAAWTKTNILSVTADADGVGDLVVPTAASAQHFVSQAGAVSGAPCVITIRAKPGGYNFVAANIGGVSTVWFNLGTGAVGSNSGGLTASIATAVDAPGYYDCTLAYTSSPGATVAFYVASADGTLTFTGDGTSGVYLARAQLETYTTTPTEYQDVPTTWPEAYLAAVGAENIFAWVDNAGATPVTAVGDTIGLSLDRAYGGRTDGSLIASGATGLTGTATAASYNTSTGAGSVSRAGDASNQSWVTWTGLTTSAIHRIRVTNTGATSLDVRNGSVSGTIVASIAAGATSYVHPLTSGGSTSITITATNNSTTATFTVLEFCRVPGTHLTQATGTARPTLSARVNRLLATEALNGVSWTKAFGGTGSTPVVTDAYTTDDEGRNASRVVLDKGAGATLSDISNLNQASSGAISGTAYRARFKVKATSAGEVGKVILFRQAAGAGYLQITLTDSWQIVARDETAAGASITYDFALRGTLGSANSADFLVSQVDLRTADDAAKNLPAYQRVGATAADHDTDGFPHYALFDGTDDSWASTSTVDGSGSDKVTVVAGVTKNSDAAAGVVLELSASVSLNNGTFMVDAPDTAAANYGFYLRGTTTRGRLATTYAAPISSVFAVGFDTGAAVAGQNLPRVNGATPTLTAAVGAGAANFANATLYVGSRAGTSLRLNGRIYSLVFRFGAMGEADRNRSEQWNKNLMRLP